MAYLFPQDVENGDGLDGLPEAHLVCQDDVGVLCPREPHPVYTCITMPNIVITNLLSYHP